MVKRTILIAGLGLIGGSIAKAIKQSNEHHILGYDVNEHTVQYALTHGMIHEEGIIVFPRQRKKQISYYFSRPDFRKRFLCCSSCSKLLLRKMSL